MSSHPNSSPTESLSGRWSTPERIKQLAEKENEEYWGAL
jgi:hypothetical protein